jgi:acyl transferase domain-containing protein
MGPMGRHVALLFPGQGSQHTRMAAGLYGHEPVFTAAMDNVFQVLGDEGRRVRDDWLADRPGVDIDDVGRAQPLLLAVDHALGRLVMSWGVRPAALLGHSVGELAAAVLAGVFTLADAVRILHDRVTRLAGTPPGGMLAVAAAAAELEPYLVDGVALAAVNGPRQTLLAGLESPLAATERALREAGYTCARAAARHAFHAPVIWPALAGSEVSLAQAPMCAPALPVFSGYTAAVMSPEEATDPVFWARQPATPVMFGPALDALLATGDFLLVEAGPGQGLSMLARRHRAVAAGRSAVVALLPARPGTADDDRRTVLAAAMTIRAEAGDLLQESRPGRPVIRHGR